MITTFSTQNRFHFFRSLRSKTILLFLLVSLLPLLTLGGLAYLQAKQELVAEITNKLVAIRDIKVHQIETYFEEKIADLRVLSKNPSTIKAIHAFHEAVEAGTKVLGTDEEKSLNHYRSLYLHQPNLENANDGSAYSAVHAQYHLLFKEYLKTYSYYDLLLVDSHRGNVLYTVGKENSFGTNLISGDLVNTMFGETFKEIMKATSPDITLVKDFASEDSTVLLAAPVFEESNGTELIGMLIVQLSMSQFDSQLQERTGLGETGETLLVSAKDFLLRSNSRFAKDHTLFKVKMDNEATRVAAMGVTGVKTIIDSRGQAVIVAYQPVAVAGIQWLLIAQIDEAEAFAGAQHLLILMLSIMVIMVGIVAGMAFFLGNSLVRPMLAMTEVARKLAHGDMNQTVVIQSQDELGIMGNAFQQMISNLRGVTEDVVKISQGLAEGNLHVMPQAQYQGDFVQIKNALETALPNLGEVIADIVQVSQGLATGELQVTPKADYRGNFIQIKEALETAARKLADATTKNITQNWLKTGQMQLGTQVSGEQDLVKLAKHIITFLTTYLDMPVGLFYLLEGQEDSETTRLKLIASYAYTHRQGIASGFAIGEGVIGQAALERKTILLTKVPDRYYLQIQSGLGKALPRQVLVQPFLYEDTLKGVIELASFKPITELQQEFLSQVMPSIGIAVNTAQSRLRLQELLQQSQQQAEELQSQTEELQSQSEELQTQTEELQTQQEELTHANETMQERTKELERQRNAVQEKNLVLEQTQIEMKKIQVALETKAHELELASQYKSEFLANMSHELRTPLNSLLILSQLLAENKAGNLTNKQVEYAQTICSAGTDLLKLINDILDLSKIEAGKMEVHIEELSLTDLEEAFEKKFRPVADSKGLAFQITIAKDLPSVLHTDAQRLKQILNNLLSNAFKFTAQGEVTLNINRSAGVQNISFVVTDTGIGIPKDKQDLIFEAFQQVDGTTSRRYGGTGLGLSISRQLAYLLGGEIRLHSEEGKGSTFTLSLPEIQGKEIKSSTQKFSGSQVLTPSPVADSHLSPATTSESSGAQEFRSPDKELTDDRQVLKPTDKSLLIVEDDRKCSKVLMEIAQDKGFKCLLAEDGQQGLQLATQYQPTAIMLDIGLPKMDGWTVMEKLKENPQTRHIPVHFLSASDQVMDAKRMGAIGYLCKPVLIEQLWEAFKKIERFVAKAVKNILVVTDNRAWQREILELVSTQEVQATLTVTQTEAFSRLHEAVYDCIILDLEIEERAGLQFLEQLHQDESLSEVPVIIYTERDLTQSEELRLRQYESNLTVKTVHSHGRLLEEATLFLHQVESRLPKEKRNMLQMVHDKEAILKNKKVLIVDDDARNTFALVTVLEDKGMEAIAGKNGLEALELLAEHSNIDIILMDVMMPEMDGYEAIQKIRAQERFRKLPIIALTAKAMKGDKAKCIEAGANDYLSKPVDIDKLVSLMRVWLYR
jgi:signal transduction histidine kinase/CheY-like chemotaxis protein/HAMP domain-containing protein